MALSLAVLAFPCRSIAAPLNNLVARWFMAAMEQSLLIGDDLKKESLCSFERGNKVPLCDI